MELVLLLLPLLNFYYRETPILAFCFLAQKSFMPSSSVEWWENEFPPAEGKRVRCLFIIWNIQTYFIAATRKGGTRMISGWCFESVIHELCVVTQEEPEKFRKRVYAYDFRKRLLNLDLVTRFANDCNPLNSDWIEAERFPLLLYATPTLQQIL